MIPPITILQNNCRLSFQALVRRVGSRPSPDQKIDIGTKQAHLQERIDTFQRQAANIIQAVTEGGDDDSWDSTPVREPHIGVEFNGIGEDDSDWHGFCKPTGSRVRAEKVRVRVAFCVPEHNPYPPQGFCGFATGTLRVQILLHLLTLRNANTESQISILKNLVHYHPPDSISIQPSYARMVVGHVACCCTFVRIFLASAASLFKSPSLHQLHLPSACHCQERVLRISQTLTLWTMEASSPCVFC